MRDNVVTVPEAASHGLNTMAKTRKAEVDAAKDDLDALWDEWGKVNGKKMNTSFSVGSNSPRIAFQPKQEASNSP